MNFGSDHWTAWFDQHAAALVLFAQQIVGQRSDAEDVVQEGFVRFWRNLLPLPASSELRHSVAREIEADQAPQPVRRGRPQYLGLAGAFAAAVVVIAVIGLFVRQRSVDVHAPPTQSGSHTVVQDVKTPDNTVDSALPTVWAYRLAAMESPQQLDSLLDQHARTLLPSDKDLISMGGQIH